MAPTKKPQRRPQQLKTKENAADRSGSGLRQWLSRDSAAGDRLVLRDYIVMNAVFATFCIVQLLIVRMLMRDFTGLYFFFGFIIVAFAVASLFDYFSEKLNMGVAAGENTDSTND